MITKDTGKQSNRSKISKNERTSFLIIDEVPEIRQTIKLLCSRDRKLLWIVFLSMSEQGDY